MDLSPTIAFSGTSHIIRKLIADTSKFYSYIVDTVCFKFEVFLASCQSSRLPGIISIFWLILNSHWCNPYGFFQLFLVLPFLVAFCVEKFSHVLHYA